MVFLSAQLLTDAILELKLQVSCEAEISFPERRKTLRVNEEVLQACKKHRLVVSVICYICPFIPKLNIRQQPLQEFRHGGLRQVSPGSEKGN